MNTRRTKFSSLPVFKTRLQKNKAANENVKVAEKKHSTLGTRPAFGDITNKESNVSKSKKIKLSNVAQPIKITVIPEKCPIAEDPPVEEPPADVSMQSVGKATPPTPATKSSVVAAVMPIVDNPLIRDVDSRDRHDPLKGGPYTNNIFAYLKTREPKFKIGDYMIWQSELIPNMRAVLVDWMVEVQENFELNHETLYMAVKLMDLYLNNSKKVSRTSLQLIGATSLFLSAKFDERSPPALDDFLYICDDAYSRNELLEMEICILKSLDFDICMPLSYRFLRRYAKCGSYNLRVLTLARYILESSLMDYAFVGQSDSKMACATLLLSAKMLKCNNWDATLIHYTGRTESELIPLSEQLNRMIVSPKHKTLSTVFQKYSHKVFLQVASVPSLPVKSRFQRL